MTTKNEMPTKDIPLLTLLTLAIPVVIAAIVLAEWMDEGRLAQQGLAPGVLARAVDASSLQQNATAGVPKFASP